MNTLKLYQHQKQILEKLPKKTLLLWETGTGKSIPILKLIEKIGNFYIICPKSIKEKWIRDVEKFGVDAQVITKEEFKKHYQTLESRNLAIDESHYFHGMKSQLAKSLLAYIKVRKPKYVWCATATPVRSNPWDAYRCLSILGHTPNYRDFRDTFFQQRYFGGRTVMVPRADTDDELIEMLSKHADIVRLDECVDVPDQINVLDEIELTKEQKKKEKEIYDVEAIVYFTRKHMLENGIFVDQEGDKHVIPNYKFEKVLDYSFEKKKLLVFCRYTDQIKALADYLESKTKTPVRTVTGKTNNRQDIFDAFEKESKSIIIIQSAISAGFELPSADLCIFCSLSFSYVDYKQGRGRVLRINKLKKNTYVHLVTKGGVDEDVYESIMKKQDFNFKLYAKERS